MTDTFPDLTDVLVPPEAFDVDGWLDEIEADPDAPPRAWSVDGLGTAQWALGLVSRAEGRILVATDQADVWRAQIAEQAAEQTARVDEWEATTTRRDRATSSFMREHLTRYVLHLRDTEDRKSITLPSGKLKTSATGPSFGIIDHDQLKTWLAEHPDIDGFNDPTPSKSKLNKVVQLVECDDGTWLATVDGEVVPGVAAAPPTVTATVVPNTYGVDPSDAFA